MNFRKLPETSAISSSPFWWARWQPWRGCTSGLIKYQEKNLVHLAQKKVLRRGQTPPGLPACPPERRGAYGACLGAVF